MTDTELTWQKSTHSEEASSCVYLAATPTGKILLRESDEPETIVTTGTPQLAWLISALRTRDTRTTERIPSVPGVTRPPATHDRANSAHEEAPLPVDHKNSIYSSE